MSVSNCRKLLTTKPLLLKQVRHLNLLECHSKDLLRRHGVNIQDFRLVEDARTATSQLKDLNFKEYVVKAQILAGGRGLGHFDNGFKSGVHFTTKVDEIPPILEKMIGNKLITKQTPKTGITVNKVMVARSVNIKRETYFCIVQDRHHNGPVVVVSPSGGTDIENVAAKTPHLVRTIPIDIHEGITEKLAQEMAEFLEFRGGDLTSKAATELRKLWNLFISVDATQLEINPLVETNEGEVISVDAKLNFDDNASFRQKDIFSLDEVSESDPREVDANKYNLNYVGMDGNIGCLVNGAGLAMATMDIIKLHGGEPANFLDVGGGVNEESIIQAFRIISSDSKVKCILVNVFGGIVNCATIAKGLVNACKSFKLSIPLVVRLEGTNVKEGKRILDESKLPLIFASDLDEAASKAVAADSSRAKKAFAA
uniref:Succinate--CoA ligase [GDP-forming] subunit beta, mitochondrial n=1 Tax=Cacopsylla melanoneura TaxID=428564 RepID=A0A8D8PWG6_9HEMI